MLLLRLVGYYQIHSSVHLDCTLYTLRAAFSFSHLFYALRQCNFLSVMIAFVPCT